MSRRLVAVTIHMLASAAVALVSALIVFVVWYPPPYAAVAGGISLFTILISADLILGPVLTAVVAAPEKTRQILRRDILVIAAFQLTGLAYGLHAIATSRPVFLAFEVDRMRVVTAADVDVETLNEAPAEYRELPWTGPLLIATLRPTKPDEVVRAVELAMNGFDISTMPRYWRSYASQRELVWQAARPVNELIGKYPESAAEVRRIAAATGQPVAGLRFMPLLSRHASWVTLLAPNESRILGYLPYEGFF